MEFLICSMGRHELIDGDGLRIARVIARCLDRPDEEITRNEAEIVGLALRIEQFYPVWCRWQQAILAEPNPSVRQSYDFSEWTQKFQGWLDETVSKTRRLYCDSLGSEQEVVRTLLLLEDRGYKLDARGTSVGLVCPEYSLLPTEEDVVDATRRFFLLNPLGEMWYAKLRNPTDAQWQDYRDFYAKLHQLVRINKVYRALVALTAGDSGTTMPSSGPHTPDIAPPPHPEISQGTAPTPGPETSTERLPATPGKDDLPASPALALPLPRLCRRGRRRHTDPFPPPAVQLSKYERLQYYTRMLKRYKAEIAESTELVSDKVELADIDDEDDIVLVSVRDNVSDKVVKTTRDGKASDDGDREGGRDGDEGVAENKVVTDQ